MPYQIAEQHRMSSAPERAMPAVGRLGRRTFTQRVSRIIETTAHTLFGGDRHTYRVSRSGSGRADGGDGGSGGTIQAGELLSRSGELIVASRCSGRDTTNPTAPNNDIDADDADAATGVGERQRAAETD